MIAIFYLSSFSELELKGELAPLDFIARKLAHMAEYALLTALLHWPLSYEKLKSPLPVSAIIAFFYAVSDEVHQAFVPGRSARIYDVGVDTLGIIIAVIVIRNIYPKFKHRIFKPSISK